MDRNIIDQYVVLLNYYKKNKIINFNEAQKNLIRQVNYQATQDIELYNLIEQIKKSSNEIEIKNIIDNYYNKYQNNVIGEDKIDDEIKKTFGISIEKIHHHFLDNGNEIFYFYDIKLNRNVILENKKTDKSLVEQLKEMQSQNEIYQTNNNINNTNNMLDSLRQHDMELKMIDINEIYKYPNQLNNLNEEQTKKLKMLITAPKEMNIKYINIENMLGIDDNNRLFEVQHNKEKDIYNIIIPNEGIYNEENITTSDKIDNNYSELEQQNALKNEYEDIPEIKELDDLDETTISQIETYYNYPELLNNLPENERIKWQKYVELYKDRKVKEMSKLDAPKQLIKQDERKAGYIDALLLALITGFVGGIFTTIMTIIINK